MGVAPDYHHSLAGGCDVLPTYKLAQAVGITPQTDALLRPPTSPHSRRSVESCRCTLQDVDRLGQQSSGGARRPVVRKRVGSLGCSKQCPTQPNKGHGKGGDGVVTNRPPSANTHMRPSFGLSRVWPAAWVM